MSMSSMSYTVNASGPKPTRLHYHRGVLNGAEWDWEVVFVYN